MSACVYLLAFVMWQANRIPSASHYTVICGLSRPTMFFTLSHNGHDFLGGGGGFDEHNVCFIISANLSETFLILRRTERDIIINVQYIGLQVKCPLFLPGFSKT